VSAPEENCTPLGACLRKRAGVFESYRITGTDRLMLKVVVRSIADLDSILGQL
jgi:DNA-binding Lrp family transcriptional regulator